MCGWRCKVAASSRQGWHTAAGKLSIMQYVAGVETVNHAVYTLLAYRAVYQPTNQVLPC